ncbi:hypothetical protein KC19_VG085700 [Ceratodon purpureus]|uniref:Uncharacterized protein n=1 Tax=Ceratodon purpureus TaxID=3225 RepID=A0A8T0HNF3_CERPU|nr:hypothetical protein KC19_VG085700 [Ceratodon purpureus]
MKHFRKPMCSDEMYHNHAIPNEFRRSKRSYYPSVYNNPAEVGKNDRADLEVYKNAQNTNDPYTALGHRTFSFGVSASIQLPTPVPSLPQNKDRPFGAKIGSDHRKKVTARERPPDSTVHH